MKKLLALTLSLATALCSFSGCDYIKFEFNTGSKSESEVDSDTNIKSESKADSDSNTKAQPTENPNIDPELLGKWTLMNTLEEASAFGFRFNKNGFLDFCIDWSPQYHCDENGICLNYDDPLPTTYDGSVLSIKDHEGNEIVTAERIGNPDTNSVNGTYNFISGGLYTYFDDSHMISDAPEGTLQLIIDGDKFDVIFNNYGEYKADGESISIDRIDYGNLGELSDNYDYTIDNDRLTFTDTDGFHDYFTRAD